MEQTKWKGPVIDPGTWRRVLLERVTSLDWSVVIRDVEPFLEDRGDRQLLDRQAVLLELGRAGA